jgi:phage terminase large subunit
MIEYHISKSAFNEIYLQYMDIQQDTQIFYGGSSSGKSFFLAQRCILDVLNDQRNYLICRKVQRTIRKSVFNEIQKTITRFNMDKIFDINKSDGTITCINGAQILFAGLDDAEKIKSITPINGVITDIWIEEATETERTDILQLTKRLRGRSNNRKRMTLSFNPIYMTHWIYKEYFKNYKESPHIEKDLVIIKTTYKDNVFLTAQDIHNLENEKDEYYRNVYTFGNWGVLGNQIFKNYHVEDFNKEQFSQYIYGLDFGFASDPCAFLEMSYDKNKSIIYIINEFYELELTNDEIAKRVLEHAGSDVVICDSAEPKSIRELQLLGVRAMAAKKGKGSINFGIDWLKRQTIIIHPNCINFKREIELYRYKERDGISIPVPVDKDNHLIDALRYAFEEKMTNEDAILF